MSRPDPIRLPGDWFHVMAPLPDKPRTPDGGYESIDWRHCPLAQVCGLPGEDKPGMRNRRKRPRL